MYKNNEKPKFSYITACGVYQKILLQYFLDSFVFPTVDVSIRLTVARLLTI